MNRQNLGQFAMLRPGSPNVIPIVAYNQYNFDAIGPTRFRCRVDISFTANAVVGFEASSGALRETRSSSASSVPPLGVVINTPLAPGDTAIVQVFGQVSAAQFLETGFSAPSVGERIFLSTQLGHITSSPAGSPTYPIGIWMGNDTIHLNPA